MRAAVRLTIFVRATDSFHHQPLHYEITRRSHRTGLAGAVVFHGIAGFGAASRIHTFQMLHMHEDQPVTIVIVDDRIMAFLPDLDELVSRGLAVLDEVDMIPTNGRFKVEQTGRRRTS